MAEQSLDNRGHVPLLQALTATNNVAATDVPATLPVGLESVDRVIRDIWGRLASPRRSGTVNRQLLEELAREGHRLALPRSLRVALDYLRLWAAAADYFHRHRLHQATALDVQGHAAHVRGLTQTYKECAADITTRYGPLMHEAMLGSITDREAASGLAKAALREEPQLGQASRLDHWANTYFAGTDLARSYDTIATRRALLMDWFALATEPAPARDARTTLLFSCDQVFFAAFYPYWASTAEYLHSVNIGLHFVLIGKTVPPLVAAVQRGIELSRATARLRGMDDGGARNVTFSTITVPDYVGNQRTLYACARYLVARRVGALTGTRVFILDIDTIMVDDVATIPAHCWEGNAICAPMATGLRVLVPARRYLAGMFPVPVGALGDEAMQAIEEYIYAGLSRANSWTLDQNALAYAVECIRGQHGNRYIRDGRRELGRTFRQVPARTLYRRWQQERADGRIPPDS